MIQTIDLTCDMECRQPPATEDGVKSLPEIAGVAYTGGVMNVANIGAVAIEVGGVKAAKRVALLRDHNNRTEGVLGFADVEMSDGVIRLNGQITSESPFARDIVASGRNGFTWQMSVGLDIGKGKPVDAGKTAIVNGKETAGPFLHVTRGMLREVSVVAFGADGNTRAIIASEGDSEMDHEKEAAPDQVQAAVVDKEKLIADERRRVREIDKVFAGTIYNVSSEEADQLRASAIEDGITAEQAKARLFDVMKSNAPKVAETVDVLAQETPGVDQNCVLEAALGMSAGIRDAADHYAKQYGEETVRAARDIRGIGIQGVIQHCAKSTTHNFNDKTIRAAFEQARVTASTGGMSRLDVAGILGNVANKAMLDAYMATPVVATRLCSSRSVSDFKQVTSYRLTGGGSFSEVGANGELKFIDLSEQSYTNQAHTYGQIFGLDRQAMINDDLGAFMRVPTMFGRNAQRLKDHLFFSVMLDTIDTVYTSARGNYFSGADSALSSESLGTAERYLIEQTDDNGHPIVVSGRYLLVPPALGYVARELFTSANITTGGGSSKDRQPTGNVWQGSFEPIISPYVSNASYLNSDTMWFLFADPADVAVYEICYLNGVETPTIEQGDLDFQNLGIAWRTYIDLGVNEQDYRGAVKSLGAAS